MTRGTFCLLLSGGYIRSIEFNGDMFPSGYGDLAFSLLQEVEGIESFKEMVCEFNQNHHDYKEEILSFRGKKEEMMPYLDMIGQKYFDFWFSDWVFCKNVSGENITFKVNATEDGKRKKNFTLKQGKTVRFYFGKPYNEKRKGVA